MAQVEFIKGIIGTDSIIEDNKPQIVFIGRSNVGKSSVVNMLVGEKIARSSSTPGKTREINFFLVSKKRYFVDLPGYGYAKISEKAREKLRKHIVWYLFESKAPIERVVLIIDAQVGLKPFDEEILEELLEVGTEVTIVANKSDKLTQKDRHKIHTHFTQKGLASHVVWLSAKTGRGKNDLWNALDGKNKELL